MLKGCRNGFLIQRQMKCEWHRRQNKKEKEWKKYDWNWCWKIFNVTFHCSKSDWRRLYNLFHQRKAKKKKSLISFRWLNKTPFYRIAPRLHKCNFIPSASPIQSKSEKSNQQNNTSTSNFAFFFFICGESTSRKKMKIFSELFNWFLINLQP